MTASDLPADPITAEMLAAAHAYDLAHRPNGWSWTRPPDAQVGRLLAGAAPALRAQGAAAERARIAEAIIAEARRMGYVAGEVATAAWPHLADFVADLLETNREERSEENRNTASIPDASTGPARDSGSGHVDDTRPVDSDLTRYEVGGDAAYPRL